MAFFVTTACLRATMFVFLAICLGLTGSLIAGQENAKSQVNFMMFASVWGLLFACIYGALALFISGLAFPIILAAIDFLTTVFSFAAATALAVAIRVHACTNTAYLDANSVAEGSKDRCRQAQADTVFMYFAFLAALASTIFSVAAGFRGGWGTIPSRMSPAPAPASSVSAPHMTQV
ncbi:membrane-associating domain-containing protein [Limtongia smithiae]|uniref:membrane-associating domain-containing protein n=1 Tax=Limtongia smithiae TaxID=1125753 RepID=UPI0034CF221F